MRKEWIRCEERGCRRAQLTLVETWLISQLVGSGHPTPHGGRLRRQTGSLIPRETDLTRAAAASAGGRWLMGLPGCQPDFGSIDGFWLWKQFQTTGRLQAIDSGKNLVDWLGGHPNVWQNEPETRFGPKDGETSGSKTPNACLLLPV